MKKLFILLCICGLLWSSILSTASISTFAEPNPIYAKISYQNVYFYSLAEDQDSHRLFMLPYSYFVKLLANEGEAFYYAQYNDIFGYVKKSAVTPMQGIPQTPYATPSFRVFSMEGIGLYKKPSIYEEKIATIPYLTDSVVYYGSLQGQELIPDKSDQWFYAKYSSLDTFGYVYSVFCDKLALPPENTESFQPITTPLFSENEGSQPLSSVAMTFIIIGVSLPCLIVLCLLIKPAMLTEKITKSKPKLKARGNRDYFEFDESDLN